MDKIKHDQRNNLVALASILLIYCLCVSGALAFSFWGWNRWEQNVSVGSTATVMAHMTEQSQFELIDHFDDTSNHWYVGEPPKRGKWDGTLEIKDGIYTWTADTVREPFLYQSDFFREFPAKDFDTYLDIKFSKGTFGAVCGGLVFRKSFIGWEHGAYTFLICNNSSFNIAFYNEKGWDIVSGWRFESAILPADWNRIEINAAGDHFIFTINNKKVYELTDDRQVDGALGIMMEVHDINPAIVWFDNFGFQGH